VSRENVETFERGLEAGNRGDIDTLLETLDPEIAWHSALHALLRGEATVFRGHDGVREMIQDLYDAFGEFRIEMTEIIDRGDRLVAIGRSIARGGASGADVESPIGFVAEFKDGRAISIRAYLDPADAVEAAGTS
jgi:ketosteroid isomerase-like protein